MKNTFQSTFNKHKKLMFERYDLLREVELYHATDKKYIDSLVSGIDINKSGTKHGGAGSEQGVGFYLLKSKKDAISHAKDVGSDVIVVVDGNITPENFDIDYELDANLVRKFLHSNFEKIKPILKQLGLTQFSTGLSYRGKHGIKGLGDISKDTDPSIGTAPMYSDIMNNLKAVNQKLYSEFESYALKNCVALKYNGEEKIFPNRIEDLEGNILWKKTENIQEEVRTAPSNHAEYAINKLSAFLSNKNADMASGELVFRTDFAKLFGGYDKIIHNKKYFEECVDFVISGTHSTGHGHTDALNQIKFDYSIHSEKNEFDSILDKKFKDELEKGLTELKKEHDHRHLDVENVIKCLVINLISYAVYKKSGRV